MNAATASIIALLAIADAALIVNVRRLYRHREKSRKITRALKLALTRDAFAEEVFGRKNVSFVVPAEF